MRNLKKFFFATPRDLSMQTLSLKEIVSKMKIDDHKNYILPQTFARKVSIIMEEEYSEEDSRIGASGD